ncbi:unnamed protein product [Schistosoma margrebowiei]|uniref:Uncharacterized protein n=1 Tax=Schistosoma margrebowiei TaxID=48269 RepID=A0A183MUU5_9TREM|nr:unnamed protein product [Schistosoma margrebowiei]
MNQFVCYFIILSLYITYYYCYTIEMNPYGNFMYPSLSTSSSSVSSSLSASASSPKLLVSSSKSLPTSQSLIDKYITLNNEFNKDQFNPSSDDRFNNYYDYYYYNHHHPRMSKRADLKDLSIHSDMAFIRKLFDQKNHELLRLG